MFCVSKLRLREHVLEVAIIALMVCRGLLLRAQVGKVIRPVHEGLAVVALRVLLHRNHGQLGLDLDCSAMVILQRVGCCRRQWRKCSVHRLEILIRLPSQSLAERLAHRISLLHRHVKVFFVSVAHWLV